MRTFLKGEFGNGKYVEIKNSAEGLRNKKGRAQSHINVLEKAKVEQVLYMRERRGRKEDGN